MTTIYDDPPMTPLQDTNPGDLPPLNPVSADGVWRYEFTVLGMFRRHGLPIAPEWQIRHRATGEVADRARTLTVARARTADGSAAAGIRFMAQRKADGVYGPDMVARGVVLLQILDGTVLPAGVEESRCVCGGYLTRQAGKWLHVDTCPEEVHNDQPCPDDRVTHQFCDRPEAAQCAHHGCIRANDVNTADCQVGHDNCCGCCGAV